MLFRNRKGQNTAEYAILIGLVVASAVAMQTLVKRSVQGKVKDVVDATPAIATAAKVTIERTDPKDATKKTTSDLEAPIPFTNAGTVFTKGSQYEPYYLRSDFETASRTPEHSAEVLGGAVIRHNPDSKTQREGWQASDEVAKVE